MSKKLDRSLALVLLLMAVGGFAVWSLFTGPAVADAADLEQAIRTAQQETQSVDARLRDVQAGQDDGSEQAYRQLQATEALLPSAVDDAQSLKEIPASLERAGLSVSQFTPVSAPAGGGQPSAQTVAGLTVRAYKVEATGSMDAVTAWLRAMASRAPLTTVTSTSITGAPGEGYRLSTTVQVWAGPASTVPAAPAVPAAPQG